DAYSIVVGAEVADVFYRKNLTEEQTQPATYSVYNGDSPAPLSPSNVLPGSGIQAAGIPRTTFTLISDLPAFDNLGWMTDGVNTTTGNNVDAGLDIVSPDGIDAGGRPTGSPARVFDFAYNPPPLGSDPPTNTNYRWGEVTHMFFWSNRYHDRLYELGFTEAARNFQTNNFGRGGVGNDPVRAQAQDFSGTNNANFTTGADGSAARMQMYVFTGPNPDRVSALDLDVLLHELTHGTSQRLHANGSGLTATMSRGMGEGWSDFYARALLSDASEDVSGVYPLGAWLFYQLSPGFADNYYYGGRRFPYAVMANVGANGRPHNPLTFADIDPTQMNLSNGAYPPQGPCCSPSAFEVHNVGEVWAMALFEVRARLIQRLGFAAGNQRALQLVTDGMKLDPVNPTFLHGRDAILAADCAAYGGADELDIWNGFSVRGIGSSARVTSASSSSVTEAFDLPNLLTGTAGVSGGSCTINDGVADPGEVITLTIPVTNPFCGTTANNVVLSMESGSSTNLGSIAPGATVNALVSYLVPSGSCGTTIRPLATITSSLGTVARPISLQVGIPVVALPAVTYSSGNIATPIPDPGSVDIPIIVSTTGGIADVNVKVRLNHPFIQDVVMTLIAPDGTAVTLVRNRGGFYDANFGSGPNDCSGAMTTFDDAATQPISSGAGSFVGTYRPESPLSAFNGHRMNGTWILRVSDTFAGDAGIVGCAQLLISQQLYYCCGVPGAPFIITAGSPNVIAESATPANAAPDPDETVTVAFPLKNFGTGLTTNLVATLLPGGGVVAPSGPQNYGVVSPAGGAVSRPFTFVVRGSCGDTVTATLALHDGATDLGTLTYTMRVGALINTTNNGSNGTPISIVNSPRISGMAPAVPYPSSIDVSGMSGQITKVTATISKFNHAFTADTDVLLVGPGGQSVILMSDVALLGSGVFTLTFDDAATTPKLDYPGASGTYKPVNYGLANEEIFPAPAPAAPYGSTLSVFNGTDPNGTWKLFVVDDSSSFGTGSITGGWSLTITTTRELCVVQPCTLSCPLPMTTYAEPDQPGATVSFAMASVSGSCGVVTTSPASPSFFPIGTTTVTETATRSDGSTTVCSFPVEVLDAQPPAMSGVSATPSRIDSHDHKMVNVIVAYTDSDNSGAEPICSLTVSSNEPIDGLGDGDTSPDWEVVDAHHVRLRAERSALGTGRVYTITISCADAAGNTTTAPVTVTVPHDQRP
ncbi:MAG TPA: M36 family metallopeptidase, partial [Thermoanaerobaculia bacterium]